MPDQRQPVFASGDAVGAVLESFGIDSQFVGVFAAPDVDLNRSSGGRLMHNGQARFGDLVQITLQFKCGQVHHAWWLFGDNDFGVWLAVFDQSQRIGKDQGTRERQHHGSNDEQMEIGETIHRG